MCKRRRKSFCGKYEQNAEDFRIEEVYMDAFEGNPALSYIVRGSLPMVDMNVYVVFKNKVVQYFNDNLMDINGFCSTLYENIARDIFEKMDGVFYCTDCEILFIRIRKSK